MKILVTTFLLLFACALVLSSNQRDKLFFLQKSSGEDNTTLLVVTWLESEHEISAGCEIFTDEDLIKQVIRSSDGTPIKTLSEDEMKNVLVDCTEFTLKRRRRESENEYESSWEDSYIDSKEGRRYEQEGNRRVNARGPEADEQEAPTGDDSSSTTAGYDGIPVIFPGTKWCGAGDRAKNYDDLGLHQDTDRCCRAHDHCNDTLAPGETRKDLTNKSPFTKLSCKCDLDFYYCLDRVDTVTSNTIGNTYFNVLRRECYQEDYPLTDKCKKYRTFLKLTCLEYERNTKAPKVNQWVSAKKYKKIPFPGSLVIEIPF